MFFICLNAMNHESVDGMSEHTCGLTLSYTFFG